MILSMGHLLGCWINEMQSQSVRTVRSIKIGNSQGVNKTEWRTSRMGEEMSIVVGKRLPPVTNTGRRGSEAAQQ